MKNQLVNVTSKKTPSKPAWQKQLEKYQRQDRADKKRAQRQERADKQAECRLPGDRRGKK